MILDCHAHYLPDAYIKATGDLNPQIQRDGDQLFLGGIRLGPIARRLTMVSALLEDMAARGIDARVLSPPPFTFLYDLGPGRAEQLARLLNEELAGAGAADPRLLAIGTIPLQHPGLAARELERAVRDLKLRGAIIGSQVEGRPLDDDVFTPVFEAAEDLGATLFIHPDYIPHTALSRHYLVNLVGNPFETTGAIASLVFGGVLERFPRLKVLCAHGGGATAFVLGRLQHGWEVRPETRARLDRPPTEMVRRLYFDSVTHSLKALEFLIDMVGGDRLVYGTDDPFDMADRPYPDTELILGRSFQTWVTQWSHVGEALFGTPRRADVRRDTMM